MASIRIIYVEDWRYCYWHDVCCKPLETGLKVAGSWIGSIQCDEEVMKIVRQVTSWWNSPASLAHQRILLAKSACDILWNEVNAGFSANKEAEILFQQNRKRSSILSRFYVQWGLAKHFFDKENRGKENFAKAQILTGLTAELSGAIGRKT